MAKADLVKQLSVETENKVGMLAEVSGAISGAGANITAICAYGMDDKAHFYILTSDNAKAQEALKAKGFGVSEEEVVKLMLEDKIGSAKEISEKIKAVGIDLCYIYGSTCGCADTPALLVIKAQDNAKVVSAING